MFDTGPQFMFNLGGGPGIRVHQFGGARPQRRPRETNGQPDAPASLRSMLTGLLPLLILFVLPLLSSLFGGADSTAAGPTMHFDSPVSPYTLHRLTPRLKVDYYINPVEVADYTPRKFSQLDQRAEVLLVGQLRVECTEQMEQQNRLAYEAQGWFGINQQKMMEAQRMELPSCKRLDQMRVSRSQY